MTSEFRARLDAQIAAFRAFAAQREFSSCRLVHYIGVDTPNAKDVPLNDVEAEILGCLEEGLLVGWETNAGRLYLSVQEPDCPLPPWDKVFAEEALKDVGAILRAAGFRDEV